ncbi:MAG: hypothetical protein WCR97_02015 [Bacilli bacterium]
MKSVKKQSKIIALALVQIGFVFLATISSTYAWFTSTNKASVTVSNIIATSNEITYNLKYYKNNYNSSNEYHGYIEPGQYEENSTNIKTVTDYDTDFLSASNTHTDLSNMVPGARYTFALEVTTTFNDIDVALSLASFSNYFDNITTNLNYVLSGNDDTVTTRRVELSDAINLYVTSYDTSDTTTTSTVVANDFVTYPSSGRTGTGVINYTDKLDTDTKTNTTDNKGTVVDGSTTGEILYDDTNTELISTTFATGIKQIYFISIEFSNLDGTFYSESTPTSGEVVTGASYFKKDTTGNSNVYKYSHFEINSLKLYQK